MAVGPHFYVTAYYLFLAAEAKIATRALSFAIFYLQVAEEIILNLEKGVDLVAENRSRDVEVEVGFSRLKL